MKTTIPQLIATLSLFIVYSANAETLNFEIGDIQTIKSEFHANEASKNPIGELETQATVRFSIAYFNDKLQFYANVSDTSDEEFYFNVSAGVYFNDDQLIGFIRPGFWLRKPANTSGISIGRAFLKAFGEFEELTKSDIENLNNLRLEVTYFESDRT